MIVLCGVGKTSKIRKLLLQAVDLGILCFDWYVKLILSYKNYLKKNSLSVTEITYESSYPVIFHRSAK